MGERTQLLVSYQQRSRTENGDGNIIASCSVSLHYQWGYGRVMLMDAMSFAWGLLGERWGYETPDVQRIARWLGDRVSYSGCMNLCERDEKGTVYYDDLSRNWVTGEFQETIEDVFAHSDNNDGYAHLTVCAYTFGGGADMTLRLYDHEQRPVTLAEYITRGHGDAYATPEWQQGYQQMLENIDCRIIK
jgi:hypothetical protein